MFRLCLLLLLWVSCGSVFGDSFYKWVDSNGMTHYSETPPAEGKAKTVEIDLSPAVNVAPAAPKGGGTSAGATFSGNDKSVVIYTAAWCGVCRTAKQYFRDHKVVYTEYDVEKSAKGIVDYKRLNGHGVPIILVGDERMDGFSAGHFEQIMRRR